MYLFICIEYIPFPNSGLSILDWILADSILRDSAVLTRSLTVAFDFVRVASLAPMVGMVDQFYRGFWSKGNGNIRDALSRLLGYPVLGRLRASYCLHLTDIWDSTFSLCGLLGRSETDGRIVCCVTPLRRNASFCRGAW